EVTGPPHCMAVAPAAVPEQASRSLEMALPRHWCLRPRTERCIVPCIYPSLIGRHEAMIFGAITNSWRQQLEEQDLTVLVQEAQPRGARHIELRQTCLGRYEPGEGEHWRPVLARLASLVQTFPALTFDLAMAWPCLTQHTDPAGELFQAALQGAK